jgi:aerobic carbon-monoxide dehydrogenase medium subunit
VKPPPFDYSAPDSVAEALELLQRAPEETSVLAGGQSLVPVLNMRLAQPLALVDLNRVAGLDAIETTPEGRVRFGSMVRQRRLESEPLVRDRLPLLTEAAVHIAHLAIRTRGTVGGSLAHADPSAELPAAVSALDGRMLVRGPNGERTVPAADFFLGPLTTAIEPGELLVAVELEPPPPGSGSAFLEVARTHGAFALAAAAAVLHLDDGGGVDHVRVALAGLGGVPHVPAWLDEVAGGEAPDEALFRRVGERVRDEVEPFDDVHASAQYRKRVAAVLTARALATAAARAGQRVAA